MSPKRRKRARGRRGRQPALTNLQKKQIHKIAQEEVETVLRRVLGGLGVHHGGRKR